MRNYCTQSRNSRAIKMLVPVVTFWPIELLLHAIINTFLNDSYCLTIVSETPLNFYIKQSFIYLRPNTADEFVNQVLQVSEIGCSDYVVNMKEPEKFMKAFEAVTHLGNVRRSDRKLIFLPFEEGVPNNLLDLLSLKPTSFVPNVLLIMPSDKQQKCKTYDLVTHRFMGENKYNQDPEYLDKWNSCTEKFHKNVNLFPHDMSNLHGKVVKVAGFTYKPYSIFDLDTTATPLGRDGTEMRIMDEFCRWCNCTIEIVREDKYEWGEIFDNGTGVGVLGSVKEDRADFGISALYSWYMEYIHLDFSAADIRTGITCIAPAPRLLVSWEMPLLPFSLTMWIALLLTLIYASFALFIAEGFSIDKAFLTTFATMVSQADVSRSWRVRSITGWLLVTGLILDNAYGAGLASTFTVPKYEKSIDTVQDIVDRGIRWGATHDAWTFSLMLSQEPVIKQLVSQFRIYNADELKRISFTRSMAFGIEKLPAGYFAIGEYITQEAVPEMMLMLEDFYYEQCVVMMRKSSPYTVKLSELIGRLHESGLMLAWETQVALKYLNYQVQLEVKLSRSKRDVDVEALSLRHVVFHQVEDMVLGSSLPFTPPDGTMIR